MPIYEYRCRDCDHEFELMQKFSDPPVEACPNCSGAVQKLISLSAFHLKGNGWYVTDYARKGGQNGNSTKSSSEKSSGESSDTKTSSGSTTSSEASKTKASKTTSTGATASA